MFKRVMNWWDEYGSWVILVIIYASLAVVLVNIFSIFSMGIPIWEW